METLELNDGTVLENSNAHRDGERLYVYIQNGSSLREVFDLLIEPEKTAKIIKRAPEIETVFEGFTKLTNVTDNENGFITAVLKKQSESEE